jgi:hypothetical protein
MFRISPDVMAWLYGIYPYECRDLVQAINLLVQWDGKTPMDEERTHIAQTFQDLHTNLNLFEQELCEAKRTEDVLTLKHVRALLSWKAQVIEQNDDIGSILEAIEERIRSQELS